MNNISAPVSGVWSDLIGQETAVTVLRRAVAGGAGAMTHAWLFTGPPGSGRSNAARAFAAALQCEWDGCGQCRACRTALSGAHPDVTLVRTELLSIGVKELRELVFRASSMPTLGGYQIVVIEDADRVTERGANALLKGIEEPSPRTVWILCAPTYEEVLPTVRSRCRPVTLTTPADAAVARLLVERDGIDEPMASHAARAAQGHIGRARKLARDEEARRRRREVWQIPARLTDLGACLDAAANLVEACADEAKQQTAELDARERAELEEALGFGTKGARPRNATAALKDLENEQRLRAKRLQRDAIDRALTELTAYQRDVLTVQTGAGVPLINEDLTAELTRAAQQSTPEATLRRIDAILACRGALETNVAPLLAVEAMMIGLR